MEKVYITVLDTYFEQDTEFSDVYKINDNELALLIARVDSLQNAIRNEHNAYMQLKGRYDKDVKH